MKDLTGKTAFITGAAEGIGFYSARVLAQQGMKVMLSDINEEALQQAVASLSSEGLEVDSVVLDVSLGQQWAAAVEKTTAVFGNTHFLMSNAGVSVIGGHNKISEQDWRWVLDVNVMGVVYGCQAFAPLMKAHGEGGHIMNVASIAGVQGIQYGSPYCATKAAVVSLSESWRSEFARSGIEVSVLCPGFVRTKIYDSARNRQQRYGGPALFDDMVKAKPGMAANKEDVVTGIDVELAANRVLQGLLDNEQYIFTHPEFKDSQAARAAAISEAFDSVALNMKS